MADKDPYEHIWEVMQEVRVAMVVTHSGDGDALRARPMAARPEEDDNAIYFLTDVDAPKDQEIADNAEVCLAFADPKSQRYVSVTGNGGGSRGSGDRGARLVIGGQGFLERRRRSTHPRHSRDARPRRILGGTRLGRVRRENGGRRRDRLEAKTSAQ